MSVYRYLLAVDPSLTCSGWALFVVKDGSIASVGKIKGAPASIPMAERLLAIQQSIEALFSKLGLGAPDILLCEAPTTIRDPHNAFKVEQVRSMFETLARRRSLSVPGRVNPRSVHYEIMGLHGKQLPRDQIKASAVKTVEYLYTSALTALGVMGNGVSLSKHQDIVDALLVGRLGLTRIQAAQDGKLSLEAMFQNTERRSRGSWRVKSCGI